jgi:hypothetical protein
MIIKIYRTGEDAKLDSWIDASSIQRKEKKLACPSSPEIMILTRCTGLKSALERDQHVKDINAQRDGHHGNLLRDMVIAIYT